MDYTDELMSGEIISMSMMLSSNEAECSLLNCIECKYNDDIHNCAKYSCGKENIKVALRQINVRVQLPHYESLSFSVELSDWTILKLHAKTTKIEANGNNNIIQFVYYELWMFYASIHFSCLLRFICAVRNAMWETLLSLIPTATMI